jgi:predicted DNA-binding transcriptional regulator AlpA
MVRHADQAPPGERRWRVNHSQEGNPAPAVVPTHEKLTWNLDEIEALTGISRRTLERFKSAGKMPKPIRIGRRVVWPADSIRQWLQDQATGQGVRP